MKKIFIVIILMVVIVFIFLVSEERTSKNNSENNIIITNVDPKWDTPKWAKERCANSYIVVRCGIDLFMEIYHRTVVDRNGRYRDYNGNYLTKSCGFNQSSECDFYDSNCDNLEAKIICNEEYW